MSNQQSPDQKSQLSQHNKRSHGLGWERPVIWIALLVVGTKMAGVSIGDRIGVNQAQPIAMQIQADTNTRHRLETIIADSQKTFYKSAQPLGSLCSSTALDGTYPNAVTLQSDPSCNGIPVEVIQNAQYKELPYNYEVATIQPTIQTETTKINKLQRQYDATVSNAETTTMVAAATTILVAAAVDIGIHSF